MTKKEMIRRSRAALDAFDKLHPQEQIRRLVESGSINEKGEVLFGNKQKEFDRRKHGTQLTDS